jgi:hypothetical protein
MDQGKQSSAMSPLVDFGAVCQRVREAVEPARVHAVSLHDNKGEVLWLTESSMGPDEHNAAREAFEAFSSANGPPVLDYDLGDSRSAVLFRAVNSRRSLVGAIMIVMDSRGIKQIDKGAARLMNPKLQKVLSDFAGMRPEAAPPIAAAPTAAPSRPAAARGLRRPVHGGIGHGTGSPGLGCRGTSRPGIGRPSAGSPGTGRRGRGRPSKQQFTAGCSASRIGWSGAAPRSVPGRFGAHCPAFCAAGSGTSRPGIGRRSSTGRSST